MKKRVFVFTFCLHLSLATLTYSQVSTKLFYSDGETALKYSDIMVGTQLKFLIFSTQSFSDHYYGSLVLQDSNTTQAILSADYYNRPSSSILPAAGDFASIEYEAESNWYELGFSVEGVQFIAAKDPITTGPDAGDWFLVDYNAIDLGSCTVNLYQTNPPYGTPTFLESIVLNHVKTRDISENNVVGFDDFVVLAKYWLVTDCESDENCHMVDFDDSNSIDIIDLVEFTDYWLEKTK